MGFYLDLEPVSPQGGDYRETKIPSSFWALYAIAGFALTCMFLAANALLRDLARTGNELDSLLVYSILLAVPFYIAIGVKLFAFRKYLSFHGDKLEYGFRVGQKPVFRKVLKREEIASVELLNQKPSSNVAPAQHKDQQYYIRGHWRLGVRLKSGRLIVLDRHTEKEALESLSDALKRWVV